MVLRDASDVRAAVERSDCERRSVPAREPTEDQPRGRRSVGAGIGIGMLIGLVLDFTAVSIGCSHGCGPK